MFVFMSGCTGEKPPVVEEPSPVVEEPSPVVEEPSPVVEEPSPVAAHACGLDNSGEFICWEGGTPPVELCDSKLTDSSHTFLWTHVDYGLAGLVYKVYYDTEPITYNRVEDVLGNIETTELQIVFDRAVTDLVPCKKVYFRVVAVYPELGTSALSNEVSDNFSAH